MKVYVDFDRTLFDCERFLEDLYALINQYGIDKSLFKECQNQCIKKGFNPYTILNLVKEKKKFDEELYLKIDELIKKTSEYLFSDAILFLEYLKENNYETILLTKGNTDYQKAKVLNAKIDNYYDELIVTMKHKGNLDLDYENSVFVDDNPVEVTSILKRKVKDVIYLKRNNAKYNDIPIKKEVKIVNSLKEIIDNKEL